MKRLALFILVIVLTATLSTVAVWAADPGDVTAFLNNPDVEVPDFLNGSGAFDPYFDFINDIDVDGGIDNLTAAKVKIVIPSGMQALYNTYFNAPTIVVTDEGGTVTGARVTFPRKATIPQEYYETTVKLEGLEIQSVADPTKKETFNIITTVSAHDNAITGFGNMSTQSLTTFSHIDKDFAIPLDKNWFTTGGDVTLASLQALAITSDFNYLTNPLEVAQEGSGFVLKGTLSDVPAGTHEMEIVFTIPKEIPNVGTTITKTLAVTVNSTAPNPGTHQISGIKASTTESAIGDASYTPTDSGSSYHWNKSTPISYVIDRTAFEYSTTAVTDIADNIAWLNQNAAVSANSSHVVATYEAVNNGSDIAIKVTPNTTANTTKITSAVTVTFKSVTKTVVAATTSRPLYVYGSTLELLGLKSVTGISLDKTAYSLGETVKLTIPYSLFLWNSGETLSSSAAQSALDALDLPSEITLGTTPSGLIKTPLTFTQETSSLVVSTEAIGTGTNIKFNLKVADFTRDMPTTVAFKGVDLTGNTITGAQPNIDITTGKITLDGTDIYPADLENLVVKPGSVLLIYLDSSMFTWSNKQPNPVINVPMSYLGKVKANASSTNKTIFDSVGLYSVNSTTAALRVEFAETLASLNAKSFSNTLRLYYSNSIVDSISISGEMENEEQEIDSGDVTVDMTEAPIIVATSTARNVELDLGEGVYVYTDLRSNRRVYVALREGDDDDYDDIIDKYPSIENIFHIDYVNLADTAKVTFDRSEYGTMYIYGANGDYLGLTGEKLPLSKSYYLSDMRINMSVGSTVADDSSTLPPDESAPGDNFNPPTGTASLPGVISGIALCAILGFAGIKLLNKKED